MLAADGDTPLQACPEPPRADPEGVHADPELPGEVSTPVDSLSLRVAIVLDDQVAVFRLEPVEALVEAIERLVGAVVGRRHDRSRVVNPGPRFIVRDIAAALSNVLEEHEPRDDVTVAGGGSDLDASRLFERPADSIEGLVGEHVGCGTVAPIEVRDEPAADLQVSFALRV